MDFYDGYQDECYNIKLHGLQLTLLHDKQTPNVLYTKLYTFPQARWVTISHLDYYAVCLVYWFLMREIHLN